MWIIHTQIAKLKPWKLSSVKFSRYRYGICHKLLMWFWRIPLYPVESFHCLRHASPPAGTKCSVIKGQRNQSCVNQIDEIFAMFISMTSLTRPAAAPFYRMSKFSQTKFLRMAADPWKLQILNLVKTEAHTVCKGYVCTSYLCLDHCRCARQPVKCILRYVCWKCLSFNCIVAKYWATL